LNNFKFSYYIIVSILFCIFVLKSQDNYSTSQGYVEKTIKNNYKLVNVTNDTLIFVSNILIRSKFFPKEIVRIPSSAKIIHYTAIRDSIVKNKDYLAAINPNIFHTLVYMENYSIKDTILIEVDSISVKKFENDIISFSKDQRYLPKDFNQIIPDIFNTLHKGENFKLGEIDDKIISLNEKIDSLINLNYNSKGTNEYQYLKHLTNQNVISEIHSEYLNNILLKLPVMNVSNGLSITAGLGYSYNYKKKKNDVTIDELSTRTSIVGINDSWYERLETNSRQILTETTYQKHKPTGYIGLNYDLKGWSFGIGYSSTPQTRVVETGEYSIDTIIEREIESNNIINEYSSKELLRADNTIYNYSSGMAHFQLGYGGWGIGFNIRNPYEDNPFDNFDDAVYGLEGSFRLNLMGEGIIDDPKLDLKQISFNRKLAVYFNYHDYTDTSPFNVGIKYTRFLNKYFNGYILASAKTIDKLEDMKYTGRDYQMPTSDDYTYYVDSYEIKNNLEIKSKICFGGEIPIVAFNGIFEFKPGFNLGLIYNKSNYEKLTIFKHYSEEKNLLYQEDKKNLYMFHYKRIDLGTTLDISVNFNIWSIDGGFFTGLGETPNYIFGLGLKF